VIDIGREADLTLLYHRDEELIAKHRRAGVRHIGHWLVGTDPERFYPREVEQEYEVVFMGNNSAGGSTNVSGSDYRGRQELIEGLAEEGIDLHLFGTGWEYLGERPNVSLHPFVGGDDFARACSAAKITLGHSTNRAYLYNSWRRPFNSMACGAFHLTRYVPGMETLFDNGIHLVWFESVSEAIARARYYLDHDAERAKIAEAGRELVLGNHTWEHRISEMMKYAKLCTNDTNGKSERSEG
jgi:spore maturation protein CgeB